MLVDGGVRVLVTGRSQAALDSTKQIWGEGAGRRERRGVVMSIDALADRVKDAFGAFDCSSSTPDRRVFAPFGPEATEAMYDDVFNVNTKGPFFAAQSSRR